MIRRALRSGSSSEAGFRNKECREAQQEGVSMADFGARTKGGAVIFERSPLAEARYERRSFS